MKNLKILLAICLTICPVSLNAQAFGVKMGDPVQKYGGKPTGRTLSYRITVPNPNTEFEEYTAISADGIGICKVIGYGITHNSDNYGSALRSVFEKFKNALNEKYGSSKDYDFLRNGSIWREANEFGWSLYKKERTLESFWSLENGNIGLGDVAGINLSGKAIEPDKTYITLTYEFVNMDNCIAAANRVENKGL